jgi:pimeloyl-ACP methyl ester carboxylesterase
VATSRQVLEREGVRLSYLDFGGDGPPVVLLHGLAGHAGEWAETARWLSERAQVLALDARGHGRSEREPSDVTRAAHVADVAFVVEQLDLEPVVLIGQSLGGQTALLVAAERRDIVRGLVLADASPAEGRESEVADVQRALAGWPVPFPSRDAALSFFGGPSLAAEAWVQGLEQRDDGWWPSFDLDVIIRTLREAAGESHWEHWEAIACPTLVVRAGNELVRDAEARQMIDRLPRAQFVELHDAEHDLHLDRPLEWRRAITDFLDEFDAVAAE